MENQIKWYQSKLFWLGILITLQGCVPLFVELINKQDFSASAVLITISGIATVIIRVFFTEAKIA